MNLVIADRVALVGGVGEAVLVAQVFFNLGVDRVNGFFFRDFEQAAAGFLGNLLEDFLAVGALFLPRKPTAAAAAAAAAASTTDAASSTAPRAAHPKSAWNAVAFVVRKVNRVNDRVRALGGGDSLGQSLFASAIYAI